MLRGLGKLALGTSILRQLLISYGAYKCLPPNAQQDVKGLANSSINSVFATQVGKVSSVAACVFDYIYGLRGLKFPSEEYHQKRNEVTSKPDPHSMCQENPEAERAHSRSLLQSGAVHREPRAHYAQRVH
jgi:hypothetical protein